MPTLTLGIDVAKQNLDVFDAHFQNHQRFANTLEGIEEVIKKYASFEGKQVIIESTGVYQRLAHQKLEQAGFTVCVVNPYKTRCFAKSAGFLAKTDKVDSKMLCVYGQKLQCRPTPYPRTSLQELESLVRYKETLQEERKRQTNQQEYDHASKLVKTLIKDKIKELNQQIKQIEKRIQELLEEDDDFKNKKEQLQKVPGIGLGTIAALLCYLSELGTANRKDIASLVGVAPMAVESGTMRGRAMIKGGRANLRKALYMPILTCIRFNPPLKAFYQRLIQKGKPAKVALIAVMRKLILILNAMIKTKSPWRQKNG
jgi:transposase